MGGATRTFYLRVLEEALRLLARARADHLVIGGLAVRAVLGRGLREAEDVDVLIRADDAPRLLDVFRAEGYTTHIRDATWIVKAARPDVTIDLIYRAGESIELDGEHLARARTADLEGVALPVPGPEDLAIMKVVYDASDRRGAWYDALDILRRFDIDWNYLAARGRTLAPRRTQALLLYASEDGLDVPQDALVATSTR